MEIAHGMEIVRHGRFWAVHDGTGQLIVVAVYRKGAREVVRRLSPAALDLAPSGPAGGTAITKGRERMARATHLTIGTADRIRLDARCGNDDENENGENEVRQEVQVSVTYILDLGDTDLAAVAEAKAGEVQKAHEAAWHRIGALGSYSPGCTCQEARSCQRDNDADDNDADDNDADDNDADDNDADDNDADDNDDKTDEAGDAPQGHRLPPDPLPVNPPMNGRVRPLPAALMGREQSPNPSRTQSRVPRKS